MFARVSALLLVVPFLVAATAIPRGGYGQVNQCNTGSVQCCNSVQNTHNALVSSLAGLLGVGLDGLTVPVGVTCTPVSVLGLSGNSCTSNPVCCENNSYNGIIALGCTPINLNL